MPSTLIVESLDVIGQVEVWRHRGRPTPGDSPVRPFSDEKKPPSSSCPIFHRVLDVPQLGVKFNGTSVHRPGGVPHPTAIFLKGLPGIEQNLGRSSRGVERPDNAHARILGQSQGLQLPALARRRSFRNSVVALET